MSSYVIFIWMVSMLLVFCQSPGKENRDDIGSMTGQELSEQFCVGCHKNVEPSFLPKDQWQTVLDQMALHLGMASEIDPYKGKLLEEVYMIQQANLFATEPAMPDSIWTRLVDYYLDQAPEIIETGDTIPCTDNKLFRSSYPPVSLGGFPVVTMVQFDKEKNQIYLADLNNQLLRLNDGFTEDQITAFLAPVVHLNMVDSLHLATTQIGFLDNTDQKGGLIELTDRSSLSQRSRILIELIRPVYSETADLDGDGTLDLLVCSFGNLVGDLSWYSYAGGKYVQHKLRDTPGAIKTRILDCDDDGDLDIIALFGQAEEGISLFENNKGVFKERRLAEFNPLFGCSDFEVLDFDGDSDMDVILANGDNGDYSSIPKPYHGIRIFENQGDWNLKETAFIPINGATGVACADFDQDNDLDLFVNCFYPDYRHLDQSLIYLENNGDGTFIRQKFDLAGEGRWLVSDIGDLDQDGDLDIFVGSFALGPGQIPDSVSQVWRSQQNHLLYLENQLNP